MTINATTVGYTNDYSPASTCTGFTNPGPDRVFTISVPAGQRLTATATPATSMPQYDLSIYLVGGPAAQCTMTPVCLAGDDSGSEASANTVVYDNRSTGALDVFIVVDSFNAVAMSGSAGAFTLQTTLAPAPPPIVGTDTCNAANPITADVTYMNETLVGAANDYDWFGNPGCTTAGYAGSDRAYPVIIAAGDQLTTTVTVTGSTGTFSPSLQLTTSCPATGAMCLASSPASGNTRTLVYRNRGTAALVGFILVDNASTMPTAPYTISFDFEPAPPIPPGERCLEATVATASEMGTTIAYENNYASGTGCAVGAGLDRVYRTTVPAGQRLVSTIVSTLPDGGTGINPALSVVLGADAGVCDALSCAASSNLDSSNTETVAYFNGGSAAQPVFLIVDTTSSTDPGQNFTLTNTIATPPQGDRCENPTPLTAGTALTGQNLTTAVDDYSGLGTSCNSTATRGDLVYSMTVPPSQLLTVSVTPDSALNTSISLARSAADCNGRVCISNANTSTNGAVDSITYSNRGTAAETILIIVDSSTTGGGTFDILATLTAIPPGTSCSLAEVYVPDGGTEVGLTTNGFGNEYTTGTGCSFGSGNDRVWSVTIPAGQRGVFRATPDGGSDVLLSLVAGPAANCEGASVTCLGGENRFGTAVREELARYNTGSTAEQVFVIVDQFTGTTSGFFNFSAQFDTPPRGDRCDDPLPLVSGMATAGDFASFVNDYAGSTGGCPFDSTRADVVYSIDVPANNQLSLNVLPGAGLDTSIAIASAASACNSRTCLVNSDNGASGAADTLTVTNRSSATVTYLVIVDHNAISTVSTFTITGTVSPVPAGEFCALSTPLPSLPADGETLTGFANDYGGGGNCSPGSFSAADRVYSATVAPGRTTFIVTPDGGTNVSLSLVDAPAANCEATPRGCISGADQSTTAGAAERVSVSNSGAANRDVLLVVDTSTTTAGLFSIQRIDGPLVPGEDCESAQPLANDGGVLGGQSTVTFDNDFPQSSTNNCTGSVGRDRVYRVTVPAGQRLVATVQPDAGFDPRLDIMPGLASCQTRTCVGFPSNGTTGAADTVTYTNGASTAVDAFLVVDSTSFTATSGAGEFAISASLQTPLPGDVCSAAIPVANGTMLSGTTANMGREYNVPTDQNGCEFSGGPDIVYTATVPPGQTFAASTSMLVGDINMNLVLGPATNCRPMTQTCLTSSDSAPEQVSWTNTGTTPQQVFLIIAQWSSSSTTVPSYALSVTIN